MNWKTRFEGRICKSIDEGHGSGSMDEQQMDFLKEMLDEPGTPSDDPEFKEVSEENETPAKEVEEPPGTVNEPESADETVKEADQGDETQQTIEALRAQILALSEQVGVDPKVQTVQESVETEDKKEQKKVQAIVENYLTEDELDQLIDNPQLINVAIKRSQDAVIGSIGSIIQAEVNKQIMVNRAVTDFYQTNQDLLPYSKFVQFVMAEVEGKNRDKTYGEIFEQTASECRKRLGLAKTPVQSRQTNSTQQKPAFAGSKRGNSRPAGQQEMFDKNAQDLLDLD